MRKTMMFLIGVFFVFQIQNAAFAAPVPDYAATVEARAYNVSIDFYDIYGNGFNGDSLECSSGYFQSYTTAYNPDFTPIDSDSDSSPDSATQAGISGSGYEAEASTDTAYVFNASTAADAGYIAADSLYGTQMTSSLNGLIKISFSYDLNAVLSGFNEDGYCDASIQISFNEMGEDPSSGGSYYHRSLDIPWYATDGQWGVTGGSGDFFIGLQAGKTYSLYGGVSAYADTASPIPAPGAFWLLSTGVLGLAGIKRKTR